MSLLVFISYQHIKHSNRAESLSLCFDFLHINLQQIQHVTCYLIVQ